MVPVWVASPHVYHDTHVDLAFDAEPWSRDVLFRLLGILSNLGLVFFILCHPSHKQTESRYKYIIMATL